jgi:hypothetical protein
MIEPSLGYGLFLPFMREKSGASVTGSFSLARCVRPVGRGYSLLVLRNQSVLSVPAGTRLAHDHRAKTRPRLLEEDVDGASRYFA